MGRALETGMRRDRRVDGLGCVVAVAVARAVNGSNPRRRRDKSFIFWGAVDSARGVDGFGGS